MKPKDTCRACFAILIVIGILCIVFIGGLLDAMHPFAALDQVLSEEELKDEVIRNKAFDILKRGNRRDWLKWALVGAGLTAMGILGLRAANKLPD
jgi:hypothetical protein